MLHTPKSTLAFVFTASLFLSVSVLPSAMAINFSDVTTHARLGEQLDKMQKHIEVIQKQKQLLEDQMKAIGKAGQITIPNFDLNNIMQSIRQTVQCTLLSKDDLMAMLPGIDIEDIDISSVCQGRKLYNDVLFGKPAEYKKLSNPEKTQLNNQIKDRRTNIQRDTAVKGLALADVTLKGADDLSKAVTNLEIAASAAKDQNARLSVIAQGTAIIARGIAQSNQLLALMLKNQSMEIVTLQLPPQSLATETDKKTGATQ